MPKREEASCASEAIPSESLLPLGRLPPGYYIYRYDDIQFDQYEFKISAAKAQVVEGYHFFVVYEPNDGIQIPRPRQ